MDKDEVKKSPKANLEPHKATYWLMGLVLAVALILLALEWTTETTKMDESIVVAHVVTEEEIEVTRRDPTPPPPPPPPVPDTPEILEIVEDEVDTRLDIQEFNDETAQQTVVAPPPPPAPPREVAVAVDEIFVVVEVQPEFPGGNAAMMSWLSSNMRYPVIAQENGIQGRVITNFVVERDGSITDVQVVRGVDPSLDREAIRVVSAMPRWTPGQQRGQAVRVRFTLPVVFRLQQ
ncbi:MAG: TonB family protein [Dysgonamonadaceae bacterium]|jgi:protein TonB|nr:TonB family protein [Dysgonamonadaceae bacterium]